MSNLKKWLVNCGFFKQNKENEKPSHLLYDGGKIYVPKEKEINFLELYAQELNKGSKLYYVETRPKIFKFMIDIDMADDHFLSDDEICSLTKCINCVIVEFFDIKFNVICALSPPKNKESGVHTGIHLIWPNLFVNSETARTLRLGVIQKLYSTFGTKNKPWEDIIDEVIYTRNGYRMVGSDKMSREKVPENRPLYLKFVIDSNGDLRPKYFERLKNDPKQLMLETSIRYVVEFYECNSMEIKKIPEWFTGDIVIQKAKEGVIRSSVGSEEQFLITKFINENLPKEYINVVRDVKRTENDNLLIITNSRYCLNTLKQHNSCGIYFLATPQGICQKCLCPCENLKGRIHGLCRDFKSKVFKWKSDDLIKRLFPQFEFSEPKYNPIFDTKENKLKSEKEFCEKLLRNILS